MKRYYDETDDITNYWDDRHRVWLENPNWGVYDAKDQWFEARMSHILPIPDQPVGVVLDYGCGVALYARPLLRRFQSYIGFDPSDHAIRAAEIHYDSHPELKSRMTLLNSRSDPGEFQAGLYGIYDAIISITVLQHQIPSIRVAMIENIKRLLLPGGTYVGLEMQGQTLAYDMPPFPTHDWIEAWKPLNIVLDTPSWDRSMADDNVWVAR